MRFVIFEWLSIILGIKLILYFNVIILIMVLLFFIDVYIFGLILCLVN